MSSFLLNTRYPTSPDTSKQRRTLLSASLLFAFVLLVRVLTFSPPHESVVGAAGSGGDIKPHLNHDSTFHAAHKDHVGVLKTTHSILHKHYHKNDPENGDANPHVDVIHDQLVVRGGGKKAATSNKQQQALSSGTETKGTIDQFGYKLGVPDVGGDSGEPSGNKKFTVNDRNNGATRMAYKKSKELRERKILFSDVADTTERNKKRRDQVREEFRFAWNAYKRHAWGWDELHPISKKPRSWTDRGSGWAMTIFDSLDTLWIMGLKDEFREAVSFLDKDFELKQDNGLSTFEATIRMLGGTLAGYELSKDARLLRMAERVGWILISGLETNNGMLLDHVNFRTKRGTTMGWLNGMNLVGEIGTLQLEFRTLSLHLQDPYFDMRVTHLMSILYSGCKNKNFVCPTMFSGGSARPASGLYTLGGMADSYFEYVVKQTVLTGVTDKKLLDMSTKMLQTISENMLVTLELHDGYMATYPGTWSGNFHDHSQSRGLEHLTCFAGGMFALAALNFKTASDEQRKEWLTAGWGITETCYNMYASQPSGLSPEEVMIDRDHAFSVTRNEYRLRPETVESIFYMARTVETEAQRELWRDRGWEIFDSIRTFCRIPWGGYSGLTSVGLERPPTEQELRDNENGYQHYYDDLQQSYAHAELFKYAFMLFQDKESADKDTYVDLEEWVFNTEAHPLRVRQRDHKDIWYAWKKKHDGKPRWTAPHVEAVEPFVPELAGEYKE